MRAITEKPLRGTRVLIAEDNPILAFDIACVLRDAGAETLGPAKNLRDALMLAETSPLHCGILDVSLSDDLVFPAASCLGIAVLASSTTRVMAILKACARIGLQPKSSSSPRRRNS